MELMVFLEKVLAVLAVASGFVALSLLSRFINLDREYRGHQFLMPVIAILYSFFAMRYVNNIVSDLIQLLGFLSGIVTGIPHIGPYLNSFLYLLYTELHGSVGIFFWCNFIVIIGFCVVKKLVLPWVDSWWRRWPALYENTTGFFYLDFDGFSVLKKSFANMRTWFNVGYYAAIGVGALDCALALLYPENPVFQIALYPIFSIIVLGEISFFFDGLTFGEGVFIDIEDESRIVNIDSYALRKELKRVFGDRICLDDEIPGSVVLDPLAIKAPKDNILESDIDQVITHYFEVLEKSEIKLNEDYISATRRLMNGKSVLIYNPFYRNLTHYLLLPIIHECLNHRTCLVVCGRMTDEEDIISWLSDGIADITNLKKLWRIRKLTTISNSGLPDIGILGFEDLYDIDNVRTNIDFYNRVGLVILLEPSNLLGTGQIGLRGIAQYCERKNKKVTYCILDRNSDGLVDSLSHVIRQSITEVIASPTSNYAYSRIFWKADGPGVQSRILPRISHYLGFGTEIASLAMHEGVQDIHWYSGSKMPLVDLKWNSEQYYQPICQYIHSPKEQNEMSKRFHFHQNLWQADLNTDSFLIVEDEFNNIFEMARTFSSRVKKDGFVNILSDNYMLRDYMCDNIELFTNDPKAIPSIVPDYARTQRNFVIRTILNMVIAPIDESVLNRELSLHGCDTKDAYKAFTQLIKDHLGIDDFHIQTLRESVGVGGNRYSKFAYQVDRALAESAFDSSLKSAYYVIENERTETYPMGNRLMGHIEQVILPGQFFCYDGKYYQARNISSKNGIIVRRGADHLDARLYYRQFRNYSLDVLKEEENAQNIREIRLQNIYADISVETPGYLELKSRNYLKGGINVTLDAVRDRTINHKVVLRAEIPNANDDIRFTLCVLLNELFYTLFPSESAYIVAVPSSLPERIKNHKDYSTIIKSLVPSLDVNDSNYDGCIYFIEDSLIDLGLLVSIERNFQRIFEMLFDYLDWYLEETVEKVGDEPSSLDESQPSDDSPSSEGTESSQEDVDDSIKQEEPVEEQPIEETPIPQEPAGEIIEPENVGSTDSQPDDDSILSQDPPELPGDFDIPLMNTSASSMNNTILKDDVDGENEELMMEPGVNVWDPSAPYLRYGYREEPDWLSLKETHEFLKTYHFNDSNLHSSRKKPPEFDEGSTYDPAQPGVHYCDFCGRPLQRGKYDVLRDGRERCPECRKDAVRTRKQFKIVYQETKQEMERIFGIDFDVEIKVRMRNAKKVNDLPDKKFTPTPQFDPRVLGYAQKTDKGYTILVENGAPKWKMKSTLVHELCHIWQYTHWNDEEIAKLYPEKEAQLLVYEGMAVWTEVQYLLAMGQKELAIMLKRNRDMDLSEYGLGMQLYLHKYPIIEVSDLSDYKTPYNTLPPV